MSASPHTGADSGPVAVAKPPRIDDPLWFSAMVAYRWTVRDIMFKFQVPSAIAADIQDSWPTCRECFAIAAEASALRNQIGH
jgi:hypothetical protein